MKLVSPELNIYEIETLQQNIMKELSNCTDKFELDFTEVKKIDLSHIQLFLSLNKYCNILNLELQLTNISAKQIKQTLKMFGLNNTLGVVA